MATRRTALNTVLIVAGLAMGCNTTPHYRNIGTGRNDPIIDTSLTRVSGSIPETNANTLAGDLEDSSNRRAFDKKNVPDSVMLRDQSEMGYRDDLVPSR